MIDVSSRVFINNFCEQTRIDIGQIRLCGQRCVTLKLFVVSRRKNNFNYDADARDNSR